MKERKEEYWSKFARTFKADQEYIVGKGFSSRYGSTCQELALFECYKEVNTA